MLNTTLCYLEKDGKYLMLHRTKKEGDVNKDKWIGVGGKLKEGESPDECLGREVYEETGYRLMGRRFRGIVSFVYGDITEQMYLYTSDDFCGTETECEEGELEWIPKKDIYSLPIWEGDKIFLRLIENDAPFFTLKLSYDEEGRLTQRALHMEDERIYLSSPALDKIPWLVNAFSTRKGGVSKGVYARMNLSHTVGDEPEAVLENYRIMGRAIGVPAEDMVLAYQTHTCNVMRVGTEHKGMGIVRERPYRDVDGIMTDEPGVCLVTSHADCAALYFVDPMYRAIALSHSGWKGTVGNICKNTVEAMSEHFGSRPEDIIAAVGPAIGVECYEVGEDVATLFREAYTAAECERILRPGEDKYLLNLPEANRINMLNCGIRPENIEVSDICTCCNRDWLHSYRGRGGKRGGMCAFLMMRE